MTTGDAVEQVKAIARAARTVRGTCLVLVQALLGCTAEELARLKVGEARRRVAGFPHRKMAGVTGKVLERYVAHAELGNGDYLIKSRKGGGTKPVSRVTVWRLLSGAVKAVAGGASQVLLVLRRLHKALLAFAKEQARLVAEEARKEARRNPLRVMAVSAPSGSYMYVDGGGSGGGGSG